MTKIICQFLNTCFNDSRFGRLDTYFLMGYLAGFRAFLNIVRVSATSWTLVVRYLVA